MNCPQPGLAPSIQVADSFLLEEALVGAISPGTLGACRLSGHCRLPQAQAVGRSDAAGELEQASHSETLGGRIAPHFLLLVVGPA